MYSVLGMKDGKKIKVTWDAGEIDNEDAKDFVIRRLIDLAPRLEGGAYVAPGLQACTASLGDSVFTHITICEWFDEVKEIQGDTGIVEPEDDHIY